jgi:hypothetical protein
MAPDPATDMEDSGDPVEMLLQFCDAHGWTNERVNEDEIVATVPGSWTSYELRGIWREDDQVLQVLLMPEITIDAAKRSTLWEMLSLINERMWLGHFELWSTSNTLLYRHAAMIGGDGVSFDALEVIAHTAIDEMDRFYPAFQFVLWGGKSATEAIDAALIETRGEA